MARPTSFRLPEQLLNRVDAEAAARGMSVTALVSTLLDEGLKTSRFPGIVYRDGPAGRRAGLLGGPDVWEVIRDLKGAPGEGELRIKSLAQELAIAERQIHVALDFYATFPEEIDALLDANSRAAEQVRQLVATRERLLTA